MPQLAAGWTLSDDRLAWRFTLRPAARFHDGTPVTAAAAAACLERARSLPGVLNNAPVASVTAEDGVVVVRTTRPFVSLPAFLAHSSTIVLAPASFDGATVRAVIGTGPYRVAELLPPQRLDVERFTGWDGPPPAIGRASYLAVSRGETRGAMADGAQAELVAQLAPETLERLRRNPRVDLRVQPIARTRLVKLNCASPLFRQRQAREAFSLALDRRGIATTLMRAPAGEATQMFPPTLAEWHVPGLRPLRHDPAEARRLLAGLGWTPGTDGVLVRDGRPFRFTLRTFSDRPELPGLATAMQAQLRDVGIDMQVAVVNSGEIPAGHQDGTLDAALLTRNFVLVPDPLGTMLLDYGPKGGDWGAMNWSSPELTATLDRLGAAFDPAERAQLRGQASAILQNELPVVPVSWVDLPTAVSRRAAGVTVDAFELSYRIAAARWA